MILLLAPEAHRRIILETAMRMGETVRVISGPAEAEEILKNKSQTGLRAVIVDVTDFELEGITVLEMVRSAPAGGKIAIVAFGHSLRADLLQDAQEAGADLVLPTAAFLKQLDGVLKRYGRGRQANGVVDGFA
jgi:CheY-like chemotaxis protein